MVKNVFRTESNLEATRLRRIHMLFLTLTFILKLILCCIALAPVFHLRIKRYCIMPSVCIIEINYCKYSGRGDVEGGTGYGINPIRACAMPITKMVCFA